MANVRNPTSPDTAVMVVVQREWSDWQTATVHVTDLQQVHWYQPSRAPRPLVHAYVSCSTLVSGDLSHDCQNDSAPHRLLVCVLKSHTPATVFEDLARRADRFQAEPSR